MIRVIVSYGSGDRKAGVISDALITDETSANIRAHQELADSTYIHLSRSLALPHDPNAGIGGDVTEDFAYQPLGIYGKHMILSRTMSFTPTSATDSIEIEQYKEMIL